MERNKLYYVLFEQQNDFQEDNLTIVSREITPRLISYLPLKLPIIITGIRRSGKSTLLKILIKELHLKEKEYFYLNFSDERLIELVPDDFQKILDFLEEQNYKRNCHLLIDEIQEVQHWEKWIDRIKEKHPITITGSNSKLLSKEISTVLTGRSVNISIYPFSFKEFLKAKNIDFSMVDLDIKKQAKIRAAFSLYSELGGVPKVVMDDDTRILAELYENIIYRDIIKRFTYRLDKPIKEISTLLLSSISKKISLRSISKTVGITNLLTVKSIIDTFEGSFLFFFIHKFDYSLRKQLQNPRKVYCVDNGFVNKSGFRFSDDKGKFLENMVFLELKRRGKEIYYFSGKGECDFLTREGMNIKEAIQVCYNINAENTEREIAGLQEAMNRFNVKKGIILTLDQEEKLSDILVLPIWKWLLNFE
ncbi:ATP-binding protein [Candidatus Woesearchaeota archaeon]|nr:ATP-binding protein [Candidatus Woesearchaeota archaeon]